LTILKKSVEKFTRFPVFVPTQVLEFAKKYGVKIDIQELTLSAIAGYLTTFASLAPNSRFPYEESHETAKAIQELKTPQSRFCPFCLMFSLDELTKESLAEDCDNCSLILNSRKKPQAQITVWKHL
jgi:hypothetical protein